MGRSRLEEAPGQSQFESVQPCHLSVAPPTQDFRLQGPADASPHACPSFGPAQASTDLRLAACMALIDAGGYKLGDLH